MWRKTTSWEVVILRYPPMTKGHTFLLRAVRPEVKKYIPRSEVDHLRITTDQEVVFIHNYDFEDNHPHFLNN